ncbi:MAG: hypothetical protein RLZZ370_1790 [Bacteroidota bacterium]|jgi:hypothetical protein
MTNPVDHTEWIDRYLRGELRGEELELFERRLKQDAAFALEFNTQKLLAEGIRQVRRDELKRYIAERTRQRVITLPRNKSFLIGIAASVALFAAGWLGWKSVLPKVEKGAVATNNPAAGTNAPDDRISALPPASNAQKDHTLSKEPQEVAAVMVPEVLHEDAEAVSPHEVDDGGMAPVEPAPAATSDAAPELVASVRVALAEWESELSEADMRLDETVTVAKTAPRKAITKTQANQEKAAAATERTPRTVGRDGNTAQTQYDLVFLNIPEPGISYEIKSGNQIILNNLDYLNPLLIRYRSRFFLKSAGQWYELNTQTKGRQALQAVKDKALLLEFGSE